MQLYLDFKSVMDVRNKYKYEAISVKSSSSIMEEDYEKSRKYIRIKTDGRVRSA